jgi:hypothetical protein
MKGIFEWICDVFGHRFKMDHEMTKEDDLFFTYKCKTCWMMKFVSKQKFPKSKIPFYQ